MCRMKKVRRTALAGYVKGSKRPTCEQRGNTATMQAGYGDQWYLHL